MFSESIRERGPCVMYIKRHPKPEVLRDRISTVLAWCGPPLGYHTLDLAIQSHCVST